MTPRPAPLAALLLLLLALPGVSQEDPGQPEDEIFLDRVAVDIVNVEVYVTDTEGNPVPGLTREDFTVVEDGRPVEVVNFYQVANGIPEGWRKETPVEALEADAQEAEPAPPPRAALPDQLVISSDRYGR